jgi:hypothetical protein
LFSDRRAIVDVAATSLKRRTPAIDDSTAGKFDL